ncbi:MAG: HD-GYP domain-containing protein [Lachnospiraceae bacterium]
MRYIPITKVSAGMALGQDVYDGKGNLLLARHLILGTEYIKSLEGLGFPGLYIDDSFTDGIEIHHIISPEVRREAVKNIHDLFLEHNNKANAAVEEMRIKNLVLNVVDEILSNGDVMCNMLDLKTYDDYTYYHSVNVAVLSAMIGAQYGMREKDLAVLTTAAMLHDIGKKFLPTDILNAPRALTVDEKREMIQHPRKGFEFLRETYQFPAMVALSVLEHHEWYNGDGYPLKKSGKEIPIYARIIKLADVYDAMNSKRPYHDPTEPAEIVEYIMSRSGTEFDPEIVQLFLKKIAVYPVGCEVELSNGRHAIVVENFRDFILRPRIKVLETAEEINLMNDPNARNITINKLLI